MARRLTRSKKQGSDPWSSEKTVPAKFEKERKNPPLLAMNETQAEYIADIMTKDQVVVLGPAGTGKTYIASTIAADLLRGGKINKIVLTRPNVPGGRSIGFFPGELAEKMAPWVVPFTSVIETRMGAAAYAIAVKHGDIEVVPFEVMRGRTFENAFIILDEAQNTTCEEMKMFLTRVGNDSKLVVNGDVKQSDIKGVSGLTKILQMIRFGNLPVEIVEFTLDDIVRSGVCAMWTRAFEERD